MAFWRISKETVLADLYHTAKPRNIYRALILTQLQANELSPLQVSWDQLHERLSVAWFPPENVPVLLKLPASLPRS